MKPASVALLLLLAAGCRRQEAHPLRVQLPDGGLRHRERLAHASWRSDGTFRLCAGRDADGARGGLRCVFVAGPGAQSMIRPWQDDPEFVTDPLPVDRSPDGCGVLLEDTRGTPDSGPALATFVTHAGTTRLAQWHPGPEVSGDYFALEASFSPDGRWVAVSRLAVGIGVGEKVVEIVGVTIQPAPHCP